MLVLDAYQEIETLRERVATLDLADYDISRIYEQDQKFRHRLLALLDSSRAVQARAMI